ncbi:MAG: hypothetical protein V1859_09895 [archaeon]
MQRQNKNFKNSHLLIYLMPKDDDDIYDDETDEEYLEDDEISGKEEGFMMGYDSDYREDSGDIDEDEIDKEFM